MSNEELGTGALYYAVRGFAVIAIMAMLLVWYCAAEYLVLTPGSLPDIEIPGVLYTYTPLGAS